MAEKSYNKGDVVRIRDSHPFLAGLYLKVRSVGTDAVLVEDHPFWIPFKHLESRSEAAAGS